MLVCIVHYLHTSLVVASWNLTNVSLYMYFSNQFKNDCTFWNGTTRSHLPSNMSSTENLYRILHPLLNHMIATFIVASTSHTTFSNKSKCPASKTSYYLQVRRCFFDFFTWVVCTLSCDLIFTLTAALATFDGASATSLFGECPSPPTSHPS